MQVGRAQVQVVMMVAVVMVVVVAMVVMIVMVMVITQQPGADEVDCQAHGGNEDRLVIVDRPRRQQALRRLERHQPGHAQQQQGAGVAAENLDFPGAEGKAPVAGITPCSGIGQQRQAQGQGMGAHVPAVGQQRHGVEEPAPGNFRHHHHGGQPHRQARLALGAQVAGVELVAVLPAV
ncbi:hypothetical protein D3C77_557190 [compost metagenome]